MKNNHELILVLIKLCTYLFLKKGLCKKAQSCNPWKRPKLSQVSINSRTDKLRQILYNKEKEQATIKGNNNLDGP